MKLRFILDRLDELPLFVLSIAMCVWACIPYTADGLQRSIERQSLASTHCYFTSGEDMTTKKVFLFGRHVVSHEVFGRMACITVTVPSHSLRVRTASNAHVLVEVRVASVQVEYGPAFILVKEGLLPLDRRIALSTKLKKDLRSQCDTEAKSVARSAVESAIHSLSSDVEVTVNMTSTNWCETGPVA